MKIYEITDYQGNKLIIPDDKAKKIANISGLIEVEVNGQIHYINKANIANIKPIVGVNYKTPEQLGMPDLSGGN